MKPFYTLLFIVLPIIALSQDSNYLNRSFFSDDNEENISKGDFLFGLSVGVPSEAMKPRNSLSYNSSTRELNYTEGRAPIRFFLIQVGLGL